MDLMLLLLVSKEIKVSDSHSSWLIDMMALIVLKFIIRGSLKEISMKRLSLLLALISMPFAIECAERDDLLTFASKHSVNDTANQLVKILEEKGFTIFSKIDHSQGASKVGINLPETRVIIFGNPKVGSKLMQCSSTIAIDLPQKALIWKDTNNLVWLSVNNPEYLKQRHNVQGCDPFFSKIKSALIAISNKATSNLLTK